MKQILQDLRTGATKVVEVPSPSAAPGRLLIRTSRTLISSGTEKMLVDFGRAGWVEKARQQPDKVRMVLDKARTDGVGPTLQSVMNKLDQPLPLGYCNVGRVMEVGRGVVGISPGDRVLSNGHHAEVVSVPQNLCAKIPDEVSDEEAAFAVIGAIGLQGIRLVSPSLGETVAVTGLGLIGLVTVQLLRANGCRVIGIDLDKEKLDLAASFGAEVVDIAGGEDAVAVATKMTEGRGVDAVIIAAATDSNEPVTQAAKMSRSKGRIVLVGVTGLELSRADFYEKELTFQVSHSYGPGRSDPTYEDAGVDYPIGHVRWTEQRNFGAVLELLRDSRLDVGSLISHRFALQDASSAYDVVAGSEPSLGIVLEYPNGATSGTQGASPRSIAIRTSANKEEGLHDGPSVSFIGAGNYASSVLIPAFAEAGAKLATIVSNYGVTGTHAGKKFGFKRSTTDITDALAEPGVDAVVVATRHDSHADLVVEALAAGKHVFVEKPLALSEDGLTRIEQAAEAAGRDGNAPIVMVGFNRRFAPQVLKMRELLESTSAPIVFVATVNAGHIPSNHWTQDPLVGGGRIVGEACHFVDLLRFLADSPILDHSATSVTAESGAVSSDKASMTLHFEDGSMGIIHYFANGHKSFPKERVEAFVDGRVLQLDNFRKLAGFGWPGFKRMNLWRQDKGQRACAAAFVTAVRKAGPAPVPFAEIIEVSRVSVSLADQLR